MNAFTVMAALTPDDPALDCPDPQRHAETWRDSEHRWWREALGQPIRLAPGVCPWCGRALPEETAS